MFLLCISLHCEAKNIYQPLPSDLGIDDGMSQCKQQSMWGENILQDLHADSLSDLLWKTCSSNSRSDNVP